MQDADLAVGYFDLQATCCEGAHKHHGTTVLRDVDETTRAGQLGSKAADIDAACRVAFGQTQAGQVQTAAVVKVELLVHVDDSIRIGGCTKIDARGWHASYDTGLGRQRHVLQNLLFVRHSRYSLGHANAQVHHRVGQQLKGRAPGNHLAFVQRHGGDGVQRYPHLSGESRVVRTVEVLWMVISRGHNHTVHQNTWHLDPARVERAALGNALHLGNDKATTVLGGGGNGQHVLCEGFTLHGDVAFGICTGAANKGYRDRHGLVVQQLFATQVDDAD